jgi:CRP-like cAMP-binding protein
MGSCMVSKFHHYLDLSPAEEKLLSSLEERVETFEAGDIIREKNREADDIYIVKNGWAQVLSLVDKETRSIFDFKLCGDFIGIGELSFAHALYTIEAITDVTVCPFPKKHLDIIFQQSPRLCRAFYVILSREQAMLYERVFSLGRRTALEKVAHMLLEMNFRNEVLSNGEQDEFDFPIKQEQLADILGLSTIHINRSMNELKRHSYIEYNRQKVKITDKRRLINLANFNKSFLEKPDLEWYLQPEENS